MNTVVCPPWRPMMMNREAEMLHHKLRCKIIAWSNLCTTSTLCFFPTRSSWLTSKPVRLYLNATLCVVLLSQPYHNWSCGLYQTMELQKHLKCMKQMTFGCSTGQTRGLTLADEWFGYAESECFSTTKSLTQRILNALSVKQLSADALHVKYPLSPIKIYATK